MNKLYSDSPPRPKGRPKRKHSADSESDAATLSDNSAVQKRKPAKSRASAGSSRPAKKAKKPVVEDENDDEVDDEEADEEQQANVDIEEVQYGTF